ncbi:hypothetical protein B296_00033706 [Ensete ventricosum]|uniref:Uncharacterized protein n=1 Tax=Ensete ventricosum TaxID=4639 RepID=A0A426YHC0_ENSVE|nr:hypothetical protein B296_00033706 [Ensete ventricosum]
MPDAHHSLVIQAFLVELQPYYFFWSLVEHLSVTVSEMLQRVNRYVVVEALVAGKREDQKQPRAESSRGLPPALKEKDGKT